MYAKHPRGSFLRTVIITVMLGAAMITSMPIAGRAQSDRDAILRDSLAGLRWMAAGHRDWSGYTHPGQCVAALEVIHRATSTRTQWTHRPLSADTVNDATRADGRACAAKFAPRTVRAQDLLDYQQLAVVLNDVPLLTAIVDVRLAQAKTVDERGAVLADAVQALDARRPAQVALGDSLVQRIRTLGPAARSWELIALRDLHWNKSVLTFDTAREASVTQQLSAMFRTLSRDDRMKAGLVPVAFQTRWLELQEYRRVPPAQFCQQQRTELLAEAPNGAASDSVRGETIQTFVESSNASCPMFIQSVGQPVAPFTGGEWFRPGDTTAHGPLGYPRPGHVTLVVNMPVGTGRPTAELAVYQRLFAQYANDGLDIVLVHTHQGFLWGSGDIAPATETRLTRWYDHDYLKLPFPVGVYDFGATNVPMTSLIGRDGRGYATSTSVGDEVALEAFVRQALADHTGDRSGAPSTPTSAPHQ